MKSEEESVVISVSETVESMKREDELVERICRAITSMKIPTFAEGSIPMRVAAKAIGKDATWIQAGIILGWFPVGIATKNGRKVTSLDEIKSGERIAYTIFPKAFWEVTGYVWKGNKK